MRRFFLPPAACSGSELTLTGDEAHHALRVLRVRPEERISILNGAGEILEAEVTSTDQRQVRLRVLNRRQTPPHPAHITLLQAVPKGKLFDDILEKAVELGVQRVVPILSARVVPQWEGGKIEKKLQQWRTVVVEAMKQCGQPWHPQVDAPIELPAFLARGEVWDLSLVGSLHGDGLHPRHWFNRFAADHPQSPRPRRIAIWIGPEGDFTAEEIQAIEQQGGARPITLGPLILRCETAATYCLSVVNSEMQTTENTEHTE